MKQSVVWVMAFIMMGALVFAQDYDIRKLKWGMSYDKVKEIEGLTDTLYKGEELMGMQVEVVFGCNNKGLYSVIYSAGTPSFATVASERLENKYGPPRKDLDYSFLVEQKEILMQYPKAVLGLYLDNDLTEFNRIGATYSNVDVRKIIKGGLTKRMMWEYGNTAVMLLENPMGAILSYRPKAHHELNKKAFQTLLEVLKKKAKEIKDTSGEGDKFRP